MNRKELSIEEKAKRYDKAIAHAKIMLKIIGNVTLGNLVLKNEFEIMFPELNEDERIMREMIELLRKEARDFPSSVIAEKSNSLIAWLEKQGNLMKALQISNARIGELIEKNYYLKEQLEKQGKNNMGISEATKQKLEDNLNNALEQETPESCNEFLDEQGEKELVTCPICGWEIEKQGEQKPAWSEEYKTVLNNLIYALANDRIGNDRDEYISWLKSIKDRVQPKQEWSLHYKKNETAEKLIALAECLEVDGDCLFNGLSGDDYGKFLRVLAKELTQPKQDWSEEDEARFEFCIKVLQTSDGYDTISTEWLKSLKDRYTWRPSDEQIQALDEVYKTHGANNVCRRVLFNLMNDLKKLKE